MKKYYIETYGCQMNVSQSDQLYKRLDNSGFIRVDSPKVADIIIVNACSVREHAEKKVFNRLQHLNSLKKNRDIKIVVTGCFAQNQKGYIKDADFVLGTYKLSDIPEIISNGKDRLVDVEFDEYKFLEPSYNKNLPFQSLIDITVGCDNYCTYCIVPYLRGPQISRKSRDIIESIKKLIDQGVKEIFLLGQNVNSYGKDINDISFAELLYKIHSIDGVKRIKFLSSHPKDFGADIIDVVFSLPKVSRWFHLPIQSGSDRILKLMNRKYSIEHYYRIVEKLNSFKQDFTLSTDFLVGFPGETEKDFEATVELAQKIKFDEAFMFKYSDRNYTSASKMTDKLSEEVKNKRLNTLINLQNKIEKEKLNFHKGKCRNVLIESKSRRNPDDMMGRDELNRVVIIKNKKLSPGNFYKVKITDIKGITLIGELI